MNPLKIIIPLLLLFMVYCSSPSINRIGIAELDYPESLNIVKRAEWGWVPINKGFKTHLIKYITVHHGGVEFSSQEDPVEHVKNLQSWSRSEKNWIDIPYHFMIDLKGNIYETRPINIPGDTNTEYDPTNHALIEIMGNYEIQEPNQEQLNSLVDLIKFLARKFDVDVENIKTHKDYSKMTVCPGKNLYHYFQNGYIIGEIKK